MMGTPHSIKASPATQTCGYTEAGLPSQVTPPPGKRDSPDPVFSCCQATRSFLELTPPPKMVFKKRTLQSPDKSNKPVTECELQAPHLRRDREQHRHIALPHRARPLSSTWRWGGSPMVREHVPPPFAHRPEDGCISGCSWPLFLSRVSVAF